VNSKISDNIKKSKTNIMSNYHNNIHKNFPVTLFFIKSNNRSATIYLDANLKISDLIEIIEKKYKIKISALMYGFENVDQSRKIKDFDSFPLTTAFHVKLIQ
jgi:predicted metallo-beta-lactamase superfamily hydrolase